MAEACGISQESLSLLERGHQNPTLATLQQIAAFLGVTVSEFLKDEHEICYQVYDSEVEKPDDPRQHYVSYGIRAKGQYWGSDTVFSEVGDLFLYREEAERFAALCTMNSLSPLHLTEVALDLISD